MDRKVSNILPPIIAGLISVIVNYGGTFILIFQAAQIAGLNPEQTASWVWSISIGVGITGIILSWYTKEPIITAWSTPAAAFLVTAIATVSYSEVIAAYILSAFAFFILGLSGYFGKLIRLIPSGIASGLLAGILLQFGISAFTNMTISPILAISLFFIYLITKRFSARYAIVTVLIFGFIILTIQSQINFSNLELKLAYPIFTEPTFSLNSTLSIALPLFLITLTGQYMPGLLILKNDGFKTAANINLFGIGGAFWGLVLGLISYFVLNWRLSNK